MKGIVCYLAVDGMIHIWDIANRGGNPLCGWQTFPLMDQPEETTATECRLCIAKVEEEVGGPWPFGRTLGTDPGPSGK